MLPGSRVRPAPKNFRLHPPKQRAAMRGLLAEIGVAGAVLVWVPDAGVRAQLRALEPGTPLPSPPGSGPTPATSSSTTGTSAPRRSGTSRFLPW